MAASGVQMTAASSRKKVLIRITIAVVLVMTMTTTGILVHEKIQENVSNTAEQTILTGITPTKTPPLSSESSSPTVKTSPISSISSRTKQSTPVTSEEATTSETVTHQNPTLKTPAHTMSTNPTELATVKAIKQTTTEDNATPDPPQLCSAKSIATMPLDFISINSDPCLGESSVMCNNRSKIYNVPNYCECAADGIWTIIQRRFDGSVNFYRNWTDYKVGFGDLNCEYWLGNDAIHQITSISNYILKIYLTDWDNVTKYAMYDTFRIADEADGYRLTIRGYSGDAGDSMTEFHDGQMFSTKDRDNEDITFMSLANHFSGAWWYGSTSSSSLNGQYHFGPVVSGGYGIMWVAYGKSPYYSMKETKLLIKFK